MGTCDTMLKNGVGDLDVQESLGETRKGCTHSQGYLAESERQNSQEGGARPGEGRPKQLRKGLLHPVVAAAAGCEQEPPADVGRELHHETNLRRHAFGVGYRTEPHRSMNPTLGSV